MNYLKAFSAGLIFPGTVLPIFVLITTLMGLGQIANIFLIHMIPLIYSS